MDKRLGQEPDRRHGHPARKRADTDEFWEDIGVDVESMSPKAQAVTGVVTGGLILLAAALLVAFTDFWWLIFVFGWAVFPAFSVFARGVAGLIESRSGPPAANARERELLEALQRRGELTPAEAAMETSLTVSEADKMLEDLAAKGHLDVRVRGGGLFYGLWENEGGRQELREGN
ncbi:MAG: hypothetical protein M3151_00355 [Actinomycetota bacterium]|nr:hypothetical protein [Actinomycetota bacterium]